MEDMTNPLARKIGVFYADKEWAFKTGKRLLELIPDEAIKKVRKPYSGYFIELKDGTTVEFIKANENVRGHRFSEAFIQKSVNWRVYNYIIKRMLRIAPYAAIMVDDIDDFRGGARADNWYGL